jgi:diguanylate cyclase (GGDEF)-like protein/putative nucleotidyltransferase with HDIG domain
VIALALPQREREKKILEMAPLVRTFSILFIAIALQSFLPLNTWISENFIGTAPILIVITLLFIYIGIFGLEKFRNNFTKSDKINPILIDYLYVTCSFLLLYVFLSVTGGANSSYKIILLPTVLLYTVRFGLKWGLATSGAAASILVILNLTNRLYGTADAQLELDFVYAGIFFLTAWLAGTMVDMESSIRDRLSRQVIYDDLTGVFNHRHFQDQLKQRIEDFPDRSFSLIMIDLDYFRYYNDAYGHQAGDQLLTKTAETISEIVGSQNVYRIGCDEFALFADGVKHEEAIRLAEEIREAINSISIPNILDPFWRKHLSASIGISSYPKDADNREQLIKKADDALYRAKMISGNKVESFYSILEEIKSDAFASEQNVLEKLKTFLAIINARDRYTYGHSRRVLIYVNIIATLMDLPKDEKKLLQYGAYLHDIGKIEIDRLILNKTDDLTNSEWAIIKKHPVWGAEIIKQLNDFDEIVPAVLYHHEFYNGKGYPFGVAGENIPQTARIIGIADAFDAMTIERPYKKARSYNMAIREIERCSGTQFDPEIVKIFVGYLKKFNNLESMIDVGSKHLLSERKN